MSSADPSLSLPHQSHTVPAAHPARPLFIALYPVRSLFPAARITHPSVADPQRTHRVIPRSSPPRFLSPCFLSLPSPPLHSVHPRGTPSTVSPTSRPQLTLIYVIFFGASTCYRVTRRILDLACPMCICTYVRGNTRGIVARFVRAIR